MNQNIEKIIKLIELNDEFIRSVKLRLIRSNYRAAFQWLNESGREEKGVKNNSFNSKQMDCIFESIHHLNQAQNNKAILQILKAEIEIPISDIYAMQLQEYLLYKGKGRNLLVVADMLLENIDSNEMFFLKMIKAKATESLGDRVLAKYTYENICENEPPHSKNYIEALAGLARCEIQMGQYKFGVPRLEYIRELISSIDSSGSDHFLNNIKSNTTEDLAFYRMNNGLFGEAFDLFGEVFYYRENNNITTKLVYPLGHQGIILRKNAVSKSQLMKILVVNILRLLNSKRLSDLLDKKICFPFRDTIAQNYQKSENLLQKAFDMCNQKNDENAKAWVSHHLSWVLLNSNKSQQAEELALISIKQYEINGDQRGISDCQEQLGRIYLTKNNLNIQKAEFYLNQSFNIRHKINNLHGLASSILSLSFLYWHQKQYRKSLLFMIKSAKAYQQIGMLNLVRILAIITLFSVWTVGDRDWTA
jgi:hypothetical protein